MTALELFELIVLVAGSFAATNTDNLILLVVLMGASPEQRSAHTLGFLSSALAVLAIATGAALLGAVVDPTLLGYMGLLPLSFGIYLLVRARWVAVPGSSDARTDQATNAAGGWLATAILMFSNYIWGRISDRIGRRKPLIVGGLGSWMGAVLAAFIIGFAQILTVVYLGAHFQMVVALLAIIFTLILKPSGLFGRQKELEERV